MFCLTTKFKEQHYKASSTPTSLFPGTTEVFILDYFQHVNGLKRILLNTL